MTPGSPSRMPSRVKLALLGSALAVGALGLPWMASSFEAIPALLGYQDSVLWVGLRVVVALAAIVFALQLVKVPDLRETQRIVFGASAVVFALRPLTLVLTNPTSSELSTPTMQVDRLFTPSWGIFASFLAAAIMIAATVLTHRSDDVREAAEREAARAALLEDPELAAFAGPPPAPLITSAPAEPSVVAVAPAAEPASAPVPGAEPVAAEPALAPAPVAAEPAFVPVPVPAPLRFVPEPALVAQPAAYAPPTPADPIFDPTAPHASPQPAPLGEIAPAAPSQQHPRAPMYDPTPYRPAPPASLEHTHLAMPVVKDDTGPYGPDGPSRLGDGPNLVQVEDTLAPKAAAPAPHLALLQQQAPPPAPSPAPAPHAPAPPTAPAEPRQRSVAPPGFG